MKIAFEFETPEMAQGFVSAALGRWHASIDGRIADVTIEDAAEEDAIKSLAASHGGTRTVAAPPPPAPKTKGKKSRSKGRRSRLHRRVRLDPAVRAFWRWEELYNQALTALIQSLAVGRKMSAPAMVAFARDVADKGLALREARRPKNDPRED